MNNSSPKKPFDSYMKYSGMAFQFIGAALIGLLLGRWLDKKFGLSRPIFTVVLSLFFVLSSMVMVVRQLMRNK